MEEGNSNQNRYYSDSDKAGLIPITSSIFNKAEITSQNNVEFQGIQIKVIIAVGFLVDYQEFEKKAIVTIYDYTGVLNFTFFKKEELPPLDEKKENKTPVRIFGTMSIFKDKKFIIGAKLIDVDSNSVLYHKAKVIHAWLYLTGKLGENRIVASEQKNQNENSFENQEEEAVNILRKFSKNNNGKIVSYSKMNELLRKFGNKKEEIIQKLIDNSSLIDNMDDGYEFLD